MNTTNSKKIKNTQKNFREIKKTHAFDLTAITAEPLSPLALPLIATNENIQIKYWHCEKAMSHLAMNADGGELLFIHEGAGDFFCDFGHFSYTSGDFIVIPSGTIWRLTPTKNCKILIMESTLDNFALSEKGILGMHIANTI